MTAVIGCLVVFLVTFFVARHSMRGGLIAIVAVGYVYGIVRANLAEAGAHFLFDSAVLGLYAGQLFVPVAADARESYERLKPWLFVLIAWPIFLCLLPIQDPLIQLVGLRGNIFLLPILVFGVRLTERDRDDLALALAVLNVLALVVAIAEYQLGLELFFPKSEVTDIIFRSKDIAGHTAYRIPSTFTGAHAYAGTLVATIPILVDAWTRGTRRKWHAYLIIGSLVATLVGVFMAAARTHAVVLFLLLVVATFSFKLRPTQIVALLLALSLVGYIVVGNERLQRFTTLGDTDYVTSRVGSSVNSSFVDKLVEYPMGNGLGGGGTSIPFFLQDRLEHPVMLENEYARIFLELGIPGLILWLMFIVRFLAQGFRVSQRSGQLGRRLAWFTLVAYFMTGLTGIGLLTSIPQSALLFLYLGWVTAPPKEPVDARRRGVNPALGGGILPDVDFTPDFGGAGTRASSAVVDVTYGERPKTT